MPPSVHHQTSTLVLLMRLSCAVNTLKLASDGTGFIFPTEGLALHYNDNVLVDYISNFSTPYLKVWCQTTDGGVENKLGQQVSSFNSTATVKLNWTGAETPCWFNLSPDASNYNMKIGSNSPNWAFDITQRAATTVGPEYTANTLPFSTVSRDTSTSSTSTAVSTASIITNTSSETTSASVTLSSTGNSTSTTPTVPPRQSSGLSAGAQAGIGVGAAISGICIGAAVVFIRQRLQWRRKERKAEASWIMGDGEQRFLGNNPPQAMQQRVSPVTQVEGGYSAAQELHNVPGLHEMPTRVY